MGDTVRVRFVLLPLLRSKLTFPLRSFNDSLASSHATLLTLRQRASALASSLSEKYRSPTLTLKHVPKIGPALHMFSRDGVSKLEADPAAMQVQKTGSTRVYVVQVH